MPTVLTTKPLTKSQESLLFNAGISWVNYSAIKIEIKEQLPLPASIKYAIITSKNAWLAVKNKTKIKQAFVVGNKTAKQIEDANVTIIENANNAKELANQIITNHPEKSFTFLCGNKRRNELPEALKKHQIKFKEVNVYSTYLNPKEFQQEFDGILFFSPSAVISYYQKNKSKSEIAFCIGSTTANEAKMHTENIKIANQTTIENVIVQVVKELKYD